MGKVELSLWLLMGLSAELVAGFWCMRGAQHLFRPLGKLALWNWLRTYGLGELGHTWWLILALGTIALLALNTLACTCQRLGSMLRGRRQKTLEWWLRMSPQVMHIGFVVVLVGELVSFGSGVEVANLILRKGFEARLPGGERICLLHLDPGFYQGRRLKAFVGQAINPLATIEILPDNAPATVVHIGLCSPGNWGPYSLHIKRFGPRNRTSSSPSYVNLVVRTDPGVEIFFVGMGIFWLGVGGYILQLILRNRRRE